MSYQVNIASLDDFALINLRGSSEVAARYESALDVAFPKSAHTAKIDRAVTVLSLAPDHWWVRTSSHNEDAVFSKLSQAVAGEHAAVTIVTDHFHGFSVMGRDAVAALRQGFSLDLRRLGSGQCTRGGFARCGATLQVVEAGTHYELFVEASYGDYAAAWLANACGKV